MWGTGAAADVIAPSKSGDETFRAWLARAERLGSAANQVAAIRGRSFFKMCGRCSRRSPYPRSSCIESGTASSRSVPVAIWPTRFLAPSTLSFPATTNVLRR